MKSQKSIVHHFPATLIQGQQIPNLSWLAAEEQSANARILQVILADDNFCGYHPDITSDRFYVLDFYNLRPFSSKIIRLPQGKTEEQVKETVLELEGTTSQFLKYLVVNPGAGTRSPIIHLGSQCLDSSGQRRCLYAGGLPGTRILGLTLVDKEFSRWTRLFYVRERPQVS